MSARPKNILRKNKGADDLALCIFCNAFKITGGCISL